MLAIPIFSPISLVLHVRFFAIIIRMYVLAFSTDSNSFTLFSALQQISDKTLLFFFSFPLIPCLVRSTYIPVQ